jgi:imidazolonepropionase-like amidohydrolase
MLFTLLCGGNAVKPVIIRDVTVIPMTANIAQEHRDVVVEDGVFKSIVSTEPKRKFRGDVIDGTGKFLIPGLCDAHVHLRGLNDEQPDLLFLHVANGVTTVLCMSGSKQVLRMREAIASGELLGPRIFTTGPMLGNLSPTPRTPEEARAIVREFKNDGYDFIKVYNQIPKDSYWAIIDEAKQQDIPVIGHAVRSVGIEGAIAAGQHVAHLEEFLYGYFQDGLDESKIAPLAARLKDAGIVVETTLVVYHNIIRQVEDFDAMLKSPGIEYLPKSVTHTYYAEENPYIHRFDKESVTKTLQPDFDFLRKLAKAFQTAGVRLLAATDTSTEIVIPGFALHSELQELVAAGLTAYEALSTATVNAAAFLKYPGGTIEVGKTADAVLLRADPLQDIANTRQIDGVLARGQWLPREAIDKRLAQIKDQYKP